MNEITLTLAALYYKQVKEVKTIYGPGIPNLIQGRPHEVKWFFNLHEDASKVEVLYSGKYKLCSYLIIFDNTSSLVKWKKILDKKRG